MDFLLLAVAILTILSAGLGLTRLLLHDKPRGGVVELFAMSLLLGITLVSSLSFVLGFFVSGPMLRWSVTSVCLALGWWGWQGLGSFVRPRGFWPGTRVGRLLLIVNIAQAALIGWLCRARVLGWDGLFNFEVKARLAFLNGGVMPPEFFSDPTRLWTHQNYPLMLPLAEGWLYLWLGRPDQELVKIIHWLFFVSALCLFYVANRRLEVSPWRMMIAPLLIFTAPRLVIGDGSASSGYADFPLAVFYLAALIYVAEFWRQGNFAALRLAGVLTAAGCWLKYDGLILWLCATILICAKALLSYKSWRADWRKWSQLATAIMGGPMVSGLWQVFINSVSTPTRTEIQPVTVGTLEANSWLLPEIVKGVTLEFLNVRYWGVFWVVAFGSIGWALWRCRDQETIALSMAVIIPILIYSGIYFFFMWSPLTRLLIHVTLVSAMLVGMAASTRQSGKSTEVSKVFSASR